MIVHRLGRILVSVYDISIVLPLLLERWVISLRGSASAKPAKLTTGRAS
jgi:hypothetical protein